MEQIILLLLQASRNAHIMHWKTKSFSEHLALGELYTLLDAQVDAIAEEWMGMAGNAVAIDQNAPSPFDQIDPRVFVAQLREALQLMMDAITDESLKNSYQTIISGVTAVKYKLDNLR